MPKTCERCEHPPTTHQGAGIGACSVSTCECWGYKVKEQ